MAFRIAATLLLATLLAPLASAQSSQRVYAWTDAQGVTHYSQTPPDDRRYREITMVREDGARTEEEVVPATPLTPAEARAAAKLANCDQAKRNLEALKSKASLTRLGADGKPAPITAGERDAEIARAQAQIGEFCDAE